MPKEAKDFFNDCVDWMIGRKVECADLVLNSLSVCVEGDFGADTGLFSWFDPVWHLGSPRGILVGSRQAQVEERDAHAALNTLVQELLHRTVESVSIETPTTDIDIRFSGGYWVKTFVSDPAAEYNWYLRDRKKDISVVASANGLRLETFIPTDS